MSNEWKPIETAPKDDEVLVWVDDEFGGGYDIAVWHRGQWLNSLGQAFIPSHWQPFPSPPESSS